MVDHEVQLVAHAQEKIIRLVEFVNVLHSQITLRRQFSHVGDAQFDPCHPKGVLVVAQTTHAIFNIRLLQENRVAMFCPAAGLVVQTLGNVFLGFFGGIKTAICVGKRIV